MQEPIALPKISCMTPLTIGEAINAHASANSHAPAIVFPDGAVAPYLSLQQQIERIGAALNDGGIGAGDWVAILLPDGPALAITILGVACRAAALPVNPNLTAPELDDLFAARHIKAVILSDTVKSPAGDIAMRRGICQFEAMRVMDGVQIALRSPPLDPKTLRCDVQADDIAVVLRTSGTTARPKLVSVTHRNLLSTATAIEEWFALTGADRALSVMPLYFAVGLKISLFTPLIVGASVAFPAPSGDADLLRALTELAPTWYSAGPTLHRSILERAHLMGRGRVRHSLRFIHSGAAPLPDEIHEGLESFFEVPVLQTYGASEIELVAANAAAPEGRRRGTVGKVRPGELAIRNDDGRIRAEGELGEIVARGPCVTPGYVDDPEANRAAFADGWFRTGDLGRIDADGFLTIVGRLKELINRGGEKIAPAEIDAALSRHPAVAEVAVFPVPHPRLGEDVATAVVLRPGKNATSLELRRFLRATLVPSKVPRRIHIVAALPKGETGKVLRQDLSKMFADAPIGSPSAPWDTPLELEIAEIWRRLLGRETVGRDDEFFELGGNSLLAAQMLIEVERVTGLSLPDNILFETATIGELAQAVVRRDRATNQSLLVELQPGSDRSPFFFVDGDLWGGGYYTRKIAQLLGTEYPFYNLRSHTLRGEPLPTIEQMAQDYRGLIARAQPHGPYRLGGHCNGALIAWELARQLVDAGEEVELVTMIEPITLNARPSMRLLVRTLDGITHLMTTDAKRRKEWLGSAMSFVWRAIWTADKFLHARADETTARDSLRALTLRMARRDPQAGRNSRRVQKECREAMACYIPRPVAANALSLVSESHGSSLEFAAKVWYPLAPQIEIAIVPGGHITCITTYAEALVAKLRERLEALDRAKERGERRTTATNKRFSAQN